MSFFGKVKVELTSANEHYNNIISSQLANPHQQM